MPHARSPYDLSRSLVREHRPWHLLYIGALFHRSVFIRLGLSGRRSGSSVTSNRSGCGWYDLHLEHHDSGHTAETRRRALEKKEWIFHRDRLIADCQLSVSSTAMRAVEAV